MLAVPDNPAPLVVILDDDEGLRGALRFALELEGFKVEDHARAETLLARGDWQTPDCLIIDEVLPDMAGQDVIQSLRDRGVSWPAVLITSHPKRALREAAALLDVPIVEKPLLGDTLIRALRGALTSTPHL